MTESEAKAAAREVILAMTGVDTEPDTVEFWGVGGRRSWLVFWGRDHFVEQRLATDGTGFTLHVNDKTGEVSVFGRPNRL
jgi:hypothetical protein